MEEKKIAQSLLVKEKMLSGKRHIFEANFWEHIQVLTLGLFLVESEFLCLV
jgi:hypothetical protein